MILKKKNIISSYRYWAFISYSHNDKHHARWLHRAIERYNIPTKLVSHKTPLGESVPKRFLPLFRDQDELPASSDLGIKIEDALKASRFFIVICSPSAARSKWVNKEIEYFSKLGRQNRIFAFIVDGEPNTGNANECFPPSLRHTEPLAGDGRRYADGRINAKLKILSGMLGVGFDSLKKRETIRRRKRLFIGGSLTLFLLCVITVLSFQMIVSKSEAKFAAEAALDQQYQSTIAKIALAIEDGEIDRSYVVQALESAPKSRRGWEWGRLKQLYQTHELCYNDSATVIAQSKSGRYIAAAYENGQIMVCDVDSGISFSLLNHDPVCGMAISSERGTIVSVHNITRKIIVWDLATKTKRSTFEIDQIDPYQKYQLNADGSKIAILYSDIYGGKFLVYDIDKTKLLLKKDTLGAIALAVSFARDVDLVAVQVLWENYVWKTNDGKLVYCGSVGNNSALAISNDGSLLACSYGDTGRGSHNLIAIIDLKTGKVKFTLKAGKTNYINALAFNNNGTKLVAKNQEGQLTVWDLTEERKIMTSSTNGLAAPLISTNSDWILDGTGKAQSIWKNNPLLGSSLLNKNGEPVYSISFSPNGEKIAISSGGNIEVVNISNKSLKVTSRDGHSGLFAGDGRWLIITDLGMLSIYDTENSYNLNRILRIKKSQYGTALVTAAVDKFGKLLAYTESDGSVKIWDIKEQKTLFALPVHPFFEGMESQINSLDIDTESNYIALGGVVGVVVFDLKSNSLINQLKIESLWVGEGTGTVRFIGTKGHLIIGEHNGFIVWDSLSGEIILRRSLLEGTSWLYVLSPDESRLAIGTNHSVIIFNTKNFTELMRIKMEEVITSLAFSPDGRNLASGTEEGSVFVWRALPWLESQK
jgi:WD40 repeat protein